MTIRNHYLALALLAGVGLALGACGGGGGTAEAPVVVEPEPTPPHACDVGTPQECVDARQAELAALGDDATVAQVNAARAALADAQAALDAANAVAHRAALVAAAACTAGTAECVAAHEALVAALTADDTTTVPELAAAQAALAAVQTAKAAADQAEADQMAADAAAAALQALADTAAACTAGTQACVDANQAYVDALAADDSTSDADLAAAQAALGNVQTAKARADYAAHLQGLATAAAGCNEGTQACIDAHQALFDALNADPRTTAIVLAAAQANLDAVKSAKAAADAEAEAARLAAEAEAARQLLKDAASCTDATQACVDAHQDYVDALDADPSTTADELAAAVTLRDAAQAALDAAEAEAEAARLAAEAEAARLAALQALADAAAACTDGTDACVTAHEDYVAALEGDPLTTAEDRSAAQAALTNVRSAKELADATAERDALVTAAACTDASALCATAHDDLIAAIQGELAELRANDDATVAEIRAKEVELQLAINARTPIVAAIERQAIVDAAACTGTASDCLDAHTALVELLEGELADLQGSDTATQAQIRDKMDELAAATTARDGVQMAIDAENAAAMALATAMTAVTDAQALVDGLAEAASQADVDAANALVTAARTAVDALAADVGADLKTQVATMETTIMGHNTRIAAAEVAAEVKAATAAAATKRTAITAEGAQTTDAGLGGTGVTVAPSDTATDGNYSLDIERDREATTVTVTVHGATDPADEDFAVAMVVGDGLTMHTRDIEATATTDAMQEIAMVMTDIEAPKAVAFAKWQAADGTTPQELNVTTDTTNDTPAVTNEALQVVDANLGMVKASAFAAPVGTVSTTVLSFQQAVADTDPNDNEDDSIAAAEIAGTFNGAMGTYRCMATGAACTVTVDTKGVVSVISGQTDWAFIPVEGATSDQSDYDYLHYGFWLKTTTDDDGVLEYSEVETFAGSSAVQSTGLGSVTGTATYQRDDGAVGVYVREVYKAEDGSIDTATSGHFTADVSLTATFGQPTAPNNNIPPNEVSTLTGDITNFDLSGGEANDWAVNLARTAIASDIVTEGVANGGGTAGSWNANFHGTATPDNAGTADVDETVYPHTVVGEFNANFGNGTAAGAFGATKQ